LLVLARIGPMTGRFVMRALEPDTEQGTRIPTGPLEPGQLQEPQSSNLPGWARGQVLTTRR